MTSKDKTNRVSWKVSINVTPEKKEQIFEKIISVALGLLWKKKFPKINLIRNSIRYANHNGRTKGNLLLTTLPNKDIT